MPTLAILYAHSSKPILKAGIENPSELNDHPTMDATSDVLCHLRAAKNDSGAYLILGSSF